MKRIEVSEAPPLRRIRVKVEERWFDLSEEEAERLLAQLAAALTETRPVAPKKKFVRVTSPKQGTITLEALGDPPFFDDIWIQQWTWVDKDRRRR